MWYIINGKPYRIDDKALMHYGVKGMKWGVRKHIMDAYNGARRVQRRIGQAQDAYNRLANTARNSKLVNSVKSSYSRKKSTKPSENLTPEEARKQKAKRAVKIGTAVAATALAVYAGKKFHDTVRQKHFNDCLEFGKRQADAMFNREMKKIDLFPDRNGVSRATREALVEARYRDIIRNAGNSAHDSSFGDALRSVIKTEKNRRLLQSGKPIMKLG